MSTRPVAAPKRKPTRWRKRLGWPLAIAGIVLFVGGYIGAGTGRVILPFDPHHVIGQIGGAVLAILGVIWATSR